MQVTNALFSKPIQFPPKTSNKKPPQKICINFRQFFLIFNAKKNQFSAKSETTKILIQGFSIHYFLALISRKKNK
jgi:hypothetical protein